MAEALFMHADGVPLGTRRRRALGRTLVLAGLLLALGGARERARVLRLQHRLHGPRPSPEAVTWGLAQPTPGEVRRALQVLDGFPPPRYAALLLRAPLGTGTPLDRLAPPLLRRRGDAASRAGLARLGLDP